MIRCHEIFFFSIFIVILLSTNIYVKEVFAEDITQFNVKDHIEDINNQFDTVDFSDINSIINAQDDNSKQINLRSLATDIISGNFNFIRLFDYTKNIFLDEIYNNINMIKNILILIILSSVIKSITDSFENKSVAEIAFYINYIIIVNELFKSFGTCVNLAKNLISKIAEITQTSVPLVMSLMAFNVSRSTAFSPIIFLFSDMTIILMNTGLPIITSFMIIEIINNITGKNLIANFAELIKNSITWLLKIISMSFIGILSLQRIATPLLDNIAMRTAKFAINSVPVVGEIFSGAVDSIAIWNHVVKNSTLIALVVSIFFLCAVPIIKLAIFILIYKIIGAIIQPICDERIINCTEAAAASCALLLTCCFTTTMIFLFIVIIFISM